MSTAKTIALILLAAVIGVGVWAVARDDNGDADLREQIEAPGNGNQDGGETVPPGEIIDDVQVISTGANSAYGKGAVSSGDNARIREAVKPAIVAADTVDQFNLAWDLLVGGEDRPEFDNEGRNAIFVFLGLRSGTDYNISFSRVEIGDDGSLNLFVNTVEPTGRDILQNRGLTSPYLVVSVSESDWQPGSDSVVQLVDDDGDRIIARQTWDRGLADRSRLES